MPPKSTLTSITQPCRLTGTAQYLPVTTWHSIKVLLAPRAISERNDATEGHGQC
ncbi:hypothetical protein ARMSODRAFT_964219, partial [Armillaria solidipes]